MNNELERMWKEVMMTYSEIYPSVCLDGLRKTKQNLRKSKPWAKICVDVRIKTWNHKLQKYEKTILTKRSKMENSMYHAVHMQFILKSFMKWWGKAAMNDMIGKR
jgi:hypothetical protein